MEKSSFNDGRNTLGDEHRSSVARSARTIRSMANGLFAFSPVDARGTVLKNRRRTSNGSRRGRPDRLGLVLRRRHEHTGAQSSGRRSKKTLVAGEPESHALGRSRGGFSTKINLVVDGKGLPLAAVIAPGQSHELSSFESLVDSVCVRRRRAGAPKRRPNALAGDKGYSAGRVRKWLKARRIEDVVPTKENERRNTRFDKVKYRRRNVVERAIGWMKESRRLATRFEKLAIHFLGMIQVGIIATYLS